MTHEPGPLFPLSGGGGGPAMPSGDAQHQSSYPQIGSHTPAGGPLPPKLPPKTPASSISSALSRIRPKHWAAIGAFAVTAVVVIGLGSALLGDSEKTTTNSGQGGGNSPPVAVGDVTPCSSPPTAEVQSIDHGPAGMTVSASLLSPCSGGDLVSNNRFRLTAFDAPGRDVAAGVFDLSSNPIVVPADGGSTAVEFTFPAGTYWRTPEATVGAVTLTTHLDGSDSSIGSGVATSTAVTAFDVGTPEHGPLDAAAYSALVDITATDRGYIDAHLLDVWQPQLSSKRPDLYYDGITWQANDIVREHMELRQRYPDAKLLWSGDWPVYRIKDWWITVSGIPFGSGEAANGWCASHGYDADHCFAKLLSHRLGEEGTTLNRN
ncbi:hypothetical protein [Mycolicibacterium tusciae]|uniref:hypothetical protein n=1 Tax=Mycolicibacterium tusciae TaxID=75922 RepID=UPI00024A3266|nr:hypothetical protein [Mycolicibacterium tusciae]